MIPLGRMQNPARGFIDFSAAVIALVASILFLRAGTTGTAVGATVYAITLVTMFITSGLYHSIPWAQKWKTRMQRLDHSAIFLLIVGTYTPVVIVTFQGAWRIAILSLVWGAAILGIVLKFALRGVKPALSMSLQMAIGWSAVASMFEVARRLGSSTVWWIGVGGAIYSIGMVFKVTRWPKLAPRVFSSHELFHLMVVAAAAVHFVTIVTRVLPAAS